MRVCVCVFVDGEDGTGFCGLDCIALGCIVDFVVDCIVDCMVDYVSTRVRLEGVWLKGSISSESRQFPIPPSRYLTFDF